MFDIEELGPAQLGISGLDAGLAEDEMALQLTLHDFALNVMRPIGKELDRMTPSDVVASGSPIFDYIAEFDKLGIGPATVAELEPEAAGRLLPLVFEELGFGDPGLGLMSMILKFPSATAHATGNQNLIDQFGDKLGCWIATQPNRGSDVVDMDGANIHAGSLQDPGNLRARVGQDHVILHGQTSAWVSGSPIAECGLVYCAADYGSGYLKPNGAINGIVMLVDFNLKGVSKGKPLDKMGQRPLPQGEVFFDSVKVPMECVVVEDDRFLESFFGALTFGNMEMASVFTGVAKAAYEHALAYCHERIQGGVRLIDHQMTRFRVFEMFRKLEMCRAIARRAAMYNYVTGPHCLASVTAKTSVTELAVEIVGEALQLFGANGLTHEYPMEKIMRDVRASLIEDGENYVLKMKGGAWLSESYREQFGIHGSTDTFSKSTT
ncbi:acyl-CoA/acyl-ACP dehydrogenase [Pseudomonadales bacterium]|nr:acyl-CoA/acyl-ACP dehydrogenase [Pseudomonadales bacterium]